MVERAIGYHVYKISLYTLNLKYKKKPLFQMIHLQSNGSVTQIDLAFISMFAGEAISLVTIHLLLNEKEFKRIEKRKDISINIEVQPLI